MRASADILRVRTLTLPFHAHLRRPAAAVVYGNSPHSLSHPCSLLLAPRRSSLHRQGSTSSLIEVVVVVVVVVVLHAKQSKVGDSHSQPAGFILGSISSGGQLVIGE